VKLTSELWHGLGVEDVTLSGVHCVHIRLLVEACTNNGYFIATVFVTYRTTKERNDFDTNIGLRFGGYNSGRFQLLISTFKTALQTISPSRASASVNASQEYNSSVVCIIKSYN
jgi:hypothetical protein